MDDADIETLWDRLKGVNAGLLGSRSGAARMVPMSHQLRDGDATIWFITARLRHFPPTWGGMAAARIIQATPVCLVL